MTVPRTLAISLILPKLPGGVSFVGMDFSSPSCPKSLIWKCQSASRLPEDWALYSVSQPASIKSVTLVPVVPQARKKRSAPSSKRCYLGEGASAPEDIAPFPRSRRSAEPVLPG